MRYFVRTTGERTLDESFSQIKYELLVDKEHNARKSFVEQLECLATLDEDVVILEDDIILCKDFDSRLKKCLEETNAKIVNFFYDPLRYYKSRKTRCLLWNQCIWYSKSILKDLSVKMRELYTKHPEQPHDEVENEAVNSLFLSVYVPRPCLVQHIDKGSLIQKEECGNRRTPYFIDYLEELRMSYEEACDPENKQKLINLMNEKFKPKEE